MNQDQRQDAVDHLSRLLERDEVTVDEYRALVDRVLSTSTELELADVLAGVPARASDDVLLVECDGGVFREKPFHLPSAIDLRCRSGVLKLDLTACGLDGFGDDVELDIENGKGVLSVIVPRGVPTEIASYRAVGGVFKSTLRPAPDQPGRPRLIIRVHNDTGVIRLRHPRRRWWFR